MKCCERDPEQKEHRHPFGGGQDLAALVALMRAERVQRLRIGGVEIQMHPSAFGATIDVDKPSPSGVENGGEPTLEQLEQWSTGQPLPVARQPEVA